MAELAAVRVTFPATARAKMGRSMRSNVGMAIARVLGMGY
jgi:hypothetical protein